MASLVRRPPWISLSAVALRDGDVDLLVAYALGFALLHWTAKPWGGAGYFSLWYPAAGLRFAVLWQRGVRLTPWLMVTEVLTDLATGTLLISTPMLVSNIMGVMRPAAASGLGVAGVRWLTRRATGPLSMEPMPFGIAAVASPVLSALLVVPVGVAFPRSQLDQWINVDMVLSLTGLVVGDLLGILVVAPSLLWLAGAISGVAPPRLARPQLRPMLEDAVVMAACLLLTLGLWRAGLGVQPTPTLLAGAWIGLRHGRTAAWFAILAAVLLFLPFSARDVGDVARLELHLSIAAVVIVSWLAGSFSDAQKAARQSLDRRNRLLFQAERLKTLRAMSVAVIHEISQPLSTLAIEARHLREITAGLDDEIVESAALVDRKAHTLSDLVRRLRRFGGRDVDEPSALPVAMLVDTARQMIAPELRANGVRLDCEAPSPDIFVQAQEVELTQALVNLLRNAVTASPNATVQLSSHVHGDQVTIAIANPAHGATAATAGMGVGLIIARTIVEAHGGALSRSDENDRVCFTITLPLTGSPA